MSEMLKGAQASIIELIVWVVGWLVCMGVLSGAYVGGVWAASYLQWDGDRGIFGLLSALAVIWVYEHRHFERRVDSIWDVLTRPRHDPWTSN
jgi:hypothetical protein